VYPRDNRLVSNGCPWGTRVSRSPSDEAQSKRRSYASARDLTNSSQRRADPAGGRLASSMPTILIRHTQCQTSHTWASGRYWA
jgi:hypothetical protein